MSAGFYAASETLTFLSLFMKPDCVQTNKKYLSMRNNARSDAPNLWTFLKHACVNFPQTFAFVLASCHAILPNGIRLLLCFLHCCLSGVRSLSLLCSLGLQFLQFDAIFFLHFLPSRTIRALIPLNVGVIKVLCPQLKIQVCDLCQLLLGPSRKHRKLICSRLSSSLLLLFCRLSSFAVLSDDLGLISERITGRASWLNQHLGIAQIDWWSSKKEYASLVVARKLISDVVWNGGIVSVCESVDFRGFWWIVGVTSTSLIWLYCWRRN